MVNLCKRIRTFWWNDESFIDIGRALLNIVSKVKLGELFRGKVAKQVKELLDRSVVDREMYISRVWLFDSVSITDICDNIIQEACRLAPDIKFHLKFLRKEMADMEKAVYSPFSVIKILDEGVPLELVSRLHSPLELTLNPDWGQCEVLMTTFRLYYLHHYDCVDGKFALREISKKLMIDKAHLSHMSSSGWVVDAMIRFMKKHVHVSCDGRHSLNRLDTRSAMWCFILKYVRDVEWNEVSKSYRVKVGSEKKFVNCNNVPSHMVSFLRDMPSFAAISALPDTIIRRFFLLHFKDGITLEGTSCELKPDTDVGYHTTYHEIEFQMRYFIKDYIPISHIGVYPIEKDYVADVDMVPFFLDHYGKYVTWNGDSYKIKHHSQGSIMARCNAMKLVKAATEKIMNIYEPLCNSDSNGVGGTYQTCQWQSIVNLFSIVHDVLIQMFGRPQITSSFVTFDVGCGQNRPMWIASNMFGHHTIGQEIDRERTKIAALSAVAMTSHEYGIRSQVALFHGDATTKANWSGIHCFFVWDVAFNEITTQDIFKNIARSMAPSHAPEQTKLSEVLLIISLRHFGRVKKQLDCYFVWEQAYAEPIELNFKVNGTGSGVRLYKLTKKCTAPPMSPPPTGPSVLQQSRDLFFVHGRRRREYQALGDRLEEKQQLSKKMRKVHKKRFKANCQKPVTKKMSKRKRAQKRRRRWSMERN